MIGILTGTDPQLTGEYLVLSAHVDHLGRGEPVNGDSIYNGAMDNASGTATLLDVARRLHESASIGGGPSCSSRSPPRNTGCSGPATSPPTRWCRPRRSSPTSTPDMFLPLFPMRSLIVNGLEESDLADDLRRVGRAAGIEISGIPSQSGTRSCAAIRYSFIRRGVPALAFKIGSTLGSRTTRSSGAGGRAVPRAVRRPEPASRPAERPTTSPRFYAAVVEAIANRDTRPRWNDVSFFKRFDAMNRAHVVRARCRAAIPRCS